MPLPLHGKTKAWGALTMRTANLRLLPVLVSFCISALCSVASAQLRSELGLPYIRNYSPKEYGADIQNWAVLQDDRGVMYFGNNLGVLEYDGVRWRLISLPNRSVARSLSKDRNGRLFVGGVDEFGYLEPDTNGERQYVSLRSQVPADALPLQDVWQTFVTPEGIYFLTFKKILRWSPERQEVKVWRGTSDFHGAFFVGGTLYVRQWEVGLLKMENDSLKLVPGGGQFADDRIYVMLPFPETREEGPGGRILVAARSGRMFLFDGKRFEPWKTEVDEYLNANLVYSPGAVLRDGRIVLNTIGGGAVVLDREGRLLQTIDKRAGLAVNTVYYLFEDRTGALWMGLDNGLARVEIEAGFSLFDERNGLVAGAYRFRRHKGTLYASTTIGIYYLDPGTSLFKQVPGTLNQCFDLVEINGQLLAASSDGVLALENGRATFIRESVNKDYEAFSVCRSRKDTNRIFVTLNNGVGSLYRTEGRWIDEGRIPGISDELRTVTETEDGRLWLGSFNRGVFRVSFPNKADGQPDLRAPEIEHFDSAQGLPPGAVLALAVQGKMNFLAQRGIFIFDEETKRFIPDSTFLVVSQLGSLDTQMLVEAPDGRVWVCFGREVAVGTPRPDGSFAWTTGPFMRFSDEIVQSIYPEQDGIVWLGTAFGGIRYDTRITSGATASFPALIRRIVAGGKQLSGGDAGTSRASLQYDGHVMRFEFAAPSYGNEERTTFRTFLEGFDATWTDWTSDRSKEYTNLQPGDYRFRVQARNVALQESTEAVYAFMVLAPWYRSWWAYLLYGLGAALFAYGLVRVRTHQLHERSRRLEETVR